MGSGSVTPGGGSYGPSRVGSPAPEVAKALAAAAGGYGSCFGLASGGGHGDAAGGRARQGLCGAHAIGRQGRAGKGVQGLQQTKSRGQLSQASLVYVPLPCGADGDEQVVALPPAIEEELPPPPLLPPGTTGIKNIGAAGGGEASGSSPEAVERPAMRRHAAVLGLVCCHLLHSPCPLNPALFDPSPAHRQHLLH